MYLSHLRAPATVSSQFFLQAGDPRDKNKEIWGSSTEKSLTNNAQEYSFTSAQNLSFHSLVSQMSAK